LVHVLILAKAADSRAAGAGCLDLSDRELRAVGLEIQDLESVFDHEVILSAPLVMMVEEK
jgi:hypothetical protein